MRDLMLRRSLISSFDLIPNFDSSKEFVNSVWLRKSFFHAYRRNSHQLVSLWYCLWCTDFELRWQCERSSPVDDEIERSSCWATGKRRRADQTAGPEMGKMHSWRKAKIYTPSGILSKRDAISTSSLLQKSLQQWGMSRFDAAGVWYSHQDTSNCRHCRMATFWPA